jgi:putative transposase
LIVDCIDQHKTEYGIEPVCTILSEQGVKIASSTYYASKTRPLSKRSLRDEQLVPLIRQVWEDNMSVYGAKKVWAQMNRQGIQVARCTVERLMAANGMRGVHKTKTVRTTVPACETEQPEDLVKRQFTAEVPNRLWVADITYIRTFSGWVYAAFVIDVFSRLIPGWQLSTRLHTDLALDALQMGIYRREHQGHDLSELIHHRDRGVQYRAIRYTQRLEEAGAVASVGSRGDSYDNALAEAFNSLFKAELIRKKGPWKSIEHLEFAVAEYIDWFNTRRLHGEIGLIPPAEAEHNYANIKQPRTPVSV